MPETNEAEIVLGLLAFTVGGQPRTVPELKWRANREWQTLHEAGFATLAAIDADTPEGIRLMLDTERGYVMAYDATHVLGDLDDATEREIDLIYDKLIAVSYPKAKSQTALMMTIAQAAARAVAESVRASFTSSPSPSGTTAALTILPTPSPSAKRSSSTPRPKRASRKSSTPA